MSQCFTSPYYWGYFISNKYLVTGDVSPKSQLSGHQSQPCIWNVVISAGYLDQNLKLANQHLWDICSAHVDAPGTRFRASSTCQALVGPH